VIETIEDKVSQPLEQPRTQPLENPATNKQIVIQVKDLKKVYKIGTEKVVALNQINLTIYKGEICCILGTSGSGKSTLLNMMAGLEKPTKGSIEIKGHAIERMTEKQLASFRQRFIGFIFQSYNLLTALTALENVAMPLIFRGTPKVKREKIAKKYLQMVGLGDRFKHKPSQMSGGQQQRVGIARAFVGSPEIIFADEPTGNLDTKTSIEVMHIMWKMAREKKQTIVIVTHDPEVALYADKVIHIRDGDIQSIENRSLDDVYDKYIKPYEENYIQI
jgi:putative ABC transport system ATP-binding protein